MNLLNEHIWEEQMSNMNIKMSIRLWVVEV